MNQIFLSGIHVSELLEQIGKLIDERIGATQSPLHKNQSKYLSRFEVALLLKISLPTLHEWTKSGWLKAYKIGNRVLYKPDEVEMSVEKLSLTKHKKGGLK